MAEPPAPPQKDPLAGHPRFQTVKHINKVIGGAGRRAGARQRLLAIPLGACAARIEAWWPPAATSRRPAPLAHPLRPAHRIRPKGPPTAPAAGLVWLCGAGTEQADAGAGGHQVCGVQVCVGRGCAVAGSHRAGQQGGRQLCSGSWGGGRGRAGQGAAQGAQGAVPHMFETCRSAACAPLRRAPGTAWAAKAAQPTSRRQALPAHGRPCHAARPRTSPRGRLRRTEGEKKHSMREIMNHMQLLHPHVVQLKEVMACEPYLGAFSPLLRRGGGAEGGRPYQQERAAVHAPPCVWAGRPQARCALPHGLLRRAGPSFRGGPVRRRCQPTCRGLPDICAPRTSPPRRRHRDGVCAGRRHVPVRGAAPGAAGERGALVLPAAHPGDGLRAPQGCAAPRCGALGWTDLGYAVCMGGRRVVWRDGAACGR